MNAKQITGTERKLRECINAYRKLKEYDFSVWEAKELLKIRFSKSKLVLKFIEGLN